MQTLTTLSWQCLHHFSSGILPTMLFGNRRFQIQNLYIDLIQMGKEDKGNLQSLTLYNGEMKQMTEEGVKINGFNVKVNISATMLDRKASGLYLGIGGGYCDLCDLSKEQCNATAAKGERFVINRDITTMKQIFEDLVQEDGTLAKHPNDYDFRSGQTSKPIADTSVRSVQVLHSLLRGFDHYMKIVIHLVAGVYHWTESKTDRLSRLLEAEKKRLQGKILDETHIKWDFPDSTGQGGNTTTGNVARKLLHECENRKIIESVIDNDIDRKIAEEYGSSLSTILRAMSSGEKINLRKYKDLTRDTYSLLIEKLPWVSITPTIHKILAHSLELIELNNNEGLKSWSEEGLEANNKRLRCYREKLARKTNQLDNLKDCFVRLWVGSDPVIAHKRAEAQPKCRKCSSTSDNCKCQSAAVSGRFSEIFM